VVDGVALIGGIKKECASNATSPRVTIGVQQLMQVHVANLSLAVMAVGGKIRPWREIFTKRWNASDSRHTGCVEAQALQEGRFWLERTQELLIIVGIIVRPAKKARV